MATVLDLVKHYQHAIEKYPNDEQKVLKSIDKLFNLDVTVQHLQETGVGRTVNALRKEAGDVGHAARSLVYKWKLMVAAEESDQDVDHNTDNTTYNGHENGRDSDDNNARHSRNKYDHYEKNTATVKTEPSEHNGNYSGTKRKHQSSEDEEPDVKKSKSTGNDVKRKPTIQIKKEHSATEDESDDSDHLDSEDSDSDSSESSREEENRKIKLEIKQEPTENHKSSSKYPSSHKGSGDHKRESSSSKRPHDSEKYSKRHHSSEPKDRHSSEKSASKEKSHSSQKHKSSKEKDKNDSSSKTEASLSEKDKRQKEDYKSSSKHKSNNDKHASSHTDTTSEKHKSQHEKHSSKSEKSKSSNHSQKSEKDKHKSSSEKEVSDEKHKSKHNSSSKERHSSSSKEKSKDKTSSSKEKTDGSKESHSHKSEKNKTSSDNKSKQSDSKHKSDKHGEGSNETKSKHKSSSSSSHKSKSSSSKSKEDVPKKKNQVSSSADSDDGIDCGSGASFAEALGMVSPAKPKKKTTSTKETLPTNTSVTKDLSPASLLAPTAKLPPLAPLEISALPDISPNYKPRPPPKLMPHFTDEEALSSVISSKNQRTKVYSGNKVIGKIPSLYEMCVQVLQEHIDALEYTGGVPYDILKPVVDRATPQQLFVLEHYNPYLMEDTDHLWQNFCQKNFRNKQRQEMETWREMYIRCQEEQEHRLKSLTANIRMTQEAKKAPIKQTKMAYVDSVVKPPRNIARKQALHGTAHAAAASPAARVASLAAAPNVLRGNTRPTPSAPVSASSFNKPKKAPLMQKALQFMRGRKR